MRRIIFLPIKLVVTASLLYVAMRGLNVSDVISKFRAIDLSWVVFALAAAIFHIWLGSIRWRVIGEKTGLNMNKYSYFHFSMVGMFFSQTLPSSIGGDAFRIWLASRATGDGAAAAYSVFIDRMIGLLALVVTVLAFLPWTYATIGNEHARLVLLLIDLGTLGAVIAFLCIGYLNGTSLAKYPIWRHATTCSTLTRQIAFDKPTRIQIAILSFAANAMVAAVAWALAKAIGCPVSYGTICQIIFPIALLTILPISIAGWGVRETTMSAAFVYAGLSAQDGLSVSILFGLAWFVAGAIGGLTWVLSGGNLSQRPAS